MGQIRFVAKWGKHASWLKGQFAQCPRAVTFMTQQDICMMASFDYTAIRILHVVVFCCKLGPLSVKPHWDYEILIRKEKRIEFW